MDSAADVKVAGTHDREAVFLVEPDGAEVLAVGAHPDAAFSLGASGVEGPVHQGAGQARALKLRPHVALGQLARGKGGEQGPDLGGLVFDARFEAKQDISGQ